MFNFTNQDYINFLFKTTILTPLNVETFSYYFQKIVTFRDQEDNNHFNKVIDCD